jgi:hypothetical protein
MELAAQPAQPTQAAPASQPSGQADEGDAALLQAQASATTASDDEKQSASEPAPADRASSTALEVEELLALLREENIVLKVRVALRTAAPHSPTCGTRAQDRLLSLYKEHKAVSDKLAAGGLRVAATAVRR